MFERPEGPPALPSGKSPEPGDPTAVEIDEALRPPVSPRRRAIQAGAVLLGCAVGDDIGFAATLLIFGPVLGLGLGALGGVLGRLLARHSHDKVIPRAAAITLPAAFSTLLAVVMVAELLGNLW